MSRRRRALERQVNVGLKAGQYVSWPASKGVSKGRVVSLHTGKVPGVVGAHTASADKPAARVQLYAKAGTGYEATTVHLAQSVDALTTIADLPEPVEAAEAVVAGSFDDIRATVQDAIKDRIESLAGMCPSIYVCDIGFTWAVYMVDYGDDLWMIEYSVGADGAVTLGDPVEVTKVTSYVPDVPPIDEPTGATLTESVSCPFDGRVLESKGTDSAGGRVFRVQLIEYGDSKNGRRWTESVLRTAAEKYNGAKAYDRHRSITELNSSTIGGLVGTYRNVQATATGLEADIHLLPSATHTAEALDLSLDNQAAGLGPLVGFSHDVIVGGWRPPVVVAGRQIREATSIAAVQSVDVVADPSAGGQALRMVAGGSGDPNTPNPNNKEFTVNHKQLLALFRATEAAKRPALLADHADTIESMGYTIEEFSREIESVATPATPAPPAAAQYDKASLTSVGIVDAAVKGAKVDVSRVRESIIADLPERFTEAELVATVDRYARATEASGLEPTVPHVDVTKDVRDRQLENFDLMLDPRKAGGYRSLKHAYVDIMAVRGSDLFESDFNKQIMRECVQNPYDSDTRATESISSSTFSTILGDSVTRRMIAEYEQPNLQNWKQIVSSIVAVNDFRTQRIEAMGGYGVLPTVAQGAPYNALTSPTGEEATAVLSKKGGTEDLTLETIANDDLRVVQRIPVKLGLAAAQTLYRGVWDVFNTNVTLTRDSTALFAAGHNNTTTTALSSTALEATRAKLRKQSAFGDTSDILSLIPKFLITVPELEALAWQLCTSAVAIPSGAPVGAAANQPNLHQGMTPIIIDYMSATSTTQWFVVADPSMAPTIEVGFYNGQEAPALFTQSDPTTGSQFTTDKLTFKIRHIWYVAPIDFRSMQRGNT
jgi:hypothetical protein